MFNHIIHNNQIRVLDKRKEVRKKLNEIQPILAACKTKECDFKAFIDDISSSGVFIKTRKHLLVGQEIAMKFIFPNGKNTIKATGEIIRVSEKGIAVEFKIFFKD
jgi:Tfp pilus assembly protein PilZ